MDNEKNRYSHKLHYKEKKSFSKKLELKFLMRINTDKEFNKISGCRTEYASNNEWTTLPQ